MHTMKKESLKVNDVGLQLKVERRKQIQCKEYRRRWDFPDGPVAKTPCSQCRGPGSIPGQGTRSHMPQLRVCMPQLKSPHAATKEPASRN